MNIDQLEKQRAYGNLSKELADLDTTIEKYLAASENSQAMALECLKILMQSARRIEAELRKFPQEPILFDALKHATGAVDNMAAICAALDDQPKNTMH